MSHGCVALLLAGAVVCAPALPALAQTAPVLAQQRFEAGLAHYRAGRHAEALDSFRASYELAPSPNSRLFIGRSLRQLGRLGDAYGELILAATEAEQRAATDPRYEPTAAAARTEAEELEPRIARITVEMAEPPPRLRVTVAGRDFTAAGLGVAVPVDPGEVEIEAQAPGHAPFRATHALEAGDSIEVTVSMDPTAAAEATEPSPLPPEERTGGSAAGIAGWASVGVAAAGAAAFVVFFLLADARFDSLSEECLPAACPPDRSDDIDEGRTFQTMANVSLGVTIGAAALGTVLLLVSHLDGASSPRRVSDGPGLVLRW